MSSPEKVRVVVVGGGPAGVGVAFGLARLGISRTLLVERNEEIGGAPCLHKSVPGGIPTFLTWRRGRFIFGDEYARKLRAKLAAHHPEVWLESQVIAVVPDEKTITLVSPARGKVELSADAVVLACGARESSLAERGCGIGSRPAGVVFSKNLLGLLDRVKGFALRQPVILGSDLIAFATAAKLRAAGCPDAALVDMRARPSSPLYERWYFRRWTRPPYYAAEWPPTVAGERSVSMVNLSDGRRFLCDAFVVSGELVPNSELALTGNLEVDLQSRKPRVGPGHQLSSPGWFAAGNILGGSHGAEWCYWNGLRVARSVARYLRRSP